MDPGTQVARVSPSQYVDPERPRTRIDFLETSLGVRETTVALRKAELLRYLLAGKTTREAADLLRIAPNTVRGYIRCEEFQKELWEADKNIWASVDEELRVSKLNNTLRLQEMSQAALDRIQGLIQSQDESIALRASSDVLDRVPDTSKHHKEERTDIKVVLDPERLLLAARAAQEMEVRASGQRYSTIVGTDASSELT